MSKYVTFNRNVSEYKSLVKKYKITSIILFIIIFITLNLPITVPINSLKIKDIIFILLMFISGLFFLLLYMSLYGKAISCRYTYRDISSDIKYLDDGYAIARFEYYKVVGFITGTYMREYIKFKIDNDSKYYDSYITAYYNDGSSHTGIILNTNPKNISDDCKYTLCRIGGLKKVPKDWILEKEYEADENV